MPAFTGHGLSMDPQALRVFKQQLLLALSDTPNEVKRLFHGRGRCWPGLEQICVDWLCGQLLISLFKEPDDAFMAELLSMLKELPTEKVWEQCGAQSLLLHHRDREGSPLEVIWGELNNYPQVMENGLKYQLDLGKKQNNGLFLDMCNGRQWVQEQRKVARFSTSLLIPVVFQSLL